MVVSRFIRRMHEDEPFDRLRTSPPCDFYEADFGRLVRDIRLYNSTTDCRPVYNEFMKARRVIRLVVALVFLIIACLLLAWALWPFGDVSRVLPIPPGNLQLPTPEGMLWGMGLVL